MSNATIHDPEFDLEPFRASIASWAASGEKRVVIEWQTGPGPTVSWFPAGERSLAKTWRYAVPPSKYNEQYADYLEYKLSPLLVEVAKGGDVSAFVVCVDQQPIVIQRRRRRELERAAANAVSSGVASASAGH